MSDFARISFLVVGAIFVVVGLAMASISHKEKTGDTSWGILVWLCGMAYFWLGVMG